MRKLLKALRGEVKTLALLFGMVFCFAMPAPRPLVLCARCGREWGK